MEPIPSIPEGFELEQKILEYIQKVDLLQLSSPYLPKTYSQWRSELYNTYTGPLSTFVSIIDNTYLPKFLQLISATYKFSILSSPALENLPKTNEVTSEILNILTDWSVQLELSVDLIHRSSLYGLYKITDSQEQIFQDLQKEWKNNEKPSSLVYKYCLTYFSSLTSKLKDYVSEALSHFLLEKVVVSHGYALVHVFYAYFSATMPYPIIAILGARFLYVFTGMVSNKIGDRIIEPIEKANLYLKLAELKGELKVLTSNLKETNLIAQGLIEKACSDPEENIRALTLLLNELISHDPEHHPDTLSANESFIAKYSNIHEEDDWVIIDPPPLYSELLEDWIIFE